MHPNTATAIELAQITGLSRQTIYEHARRAGIPPDDRHRFAVKPLLEAIVEHQRDDKRLKSPSDHRARKLELETAILEAKLAQITGESISFARARALFFSVLRSHRDRLLLLPGNLAGKLAASADEFAAEMLLADALREVLNDTAAEIRQQIDAHGSDLTAESAADSVSETRPTQHAAEETPA